MDAYYADLDLQLQEFDIFDDLIKHRCLVCLQHEKKGKKIRRIHFTANNMIGHTYVVIAVQCAVKRTRTVQWVFLKLWELKTLLQH